MELLIGRVVKAHGIKGEVAVEVHTDDPEDRFAPGVSLTGRRGSEEKTYTVKTVRFHQGRALLTLTGVPDRTAAEAMRGVKFMIDSTEVEDTQESATGPDEHGFWDHQLEGLTVVLHADADPAEGAPGDLVGTVSEVMHGPAGEILVVTRPDGRETLIPFVAPIVPVVDLEAQRAEITPPGGLLEL